MKHALPRAGIGLIARRSLVDLIACAGLTALVAGAGLAALIACVGVAPLALPGAVARAADSQTPSDPMNPGTFAGLKLRCLGPALTSGRIGDFAVDPQKPWIYYVAVSSGNVWKTVNSGTTFEPIFDDQGSYSIGCVTLDPSNPLVVWVGTGENNSQRSVGYGDGVYRSLDGGKSWKNMGLKESEHIGRIPIDPRDPNVVYVAAQGPLWSPGGDRGLYKTTDGGATWTCVLDDQREHRRQRGRDRSARPRRALRRGLPAAAARLDADRRRARVGHLQVDRRRADLAASSTNGLPSEDLGRIGLAVSPGRPGRRLRDRRGGRDKGRLSSAPSTRARTGRSAATT